ncbi:MAG: hypothetical protein IRZ07_29890, partial [Microbispora sp.]|nr:hypothetical protein [Microbispora sp.]
MHNRTALNDEANTPHTGEDPRVRAAYLRGILKGAATPPADRPDLAAAARARLAELSRADRPVPSWLTRPCPGWCTEQHQDCDHPDDRYHRSDTRAVPLLTMEFINYGSPEEPRFGPLELMCDLVQHHRETEPQINIADTSDTFSRDLSLAEAELFAWRLLALVHAARTGTIPTDPAPAA